ncbi:MAG: PQQ-binding-like beta-propeller repeat protein [Myxococcales bacterium]|nr:PQQ-binding-like beta-propeller repeat protein [Myxococcales bacterium]
MKAGDNPEIDSSAGSEDGSTGAPTSSDGTTAATASPPGCGDGVVADDEACDDANADPDDGCDATCTRTGVLAWTYTEQGALTDVTVDAAGNIYLVGGADSDLVLSLDAAGQERWRTTLPDEPVLTSIAIAAVNDADALFVAGARGDMFKLAPTGEPQWHITYLEEVTNFGFVALAVGADALYSFGSQGTFQNSTGLIQSFDYGIGDGEGDWGNSTPLDFPLIPQAIAVADAGVIAVGFGAYKPEDPVRPFEGVINADGEWQSSTILDEPGRAWTSIAPTSDGGVVLAGFGPAADIVVRRLDANLEPQWTSYEENTLGTRALAVAGGPAGALAVAGTDLELPGAFVRRLAPDGEPLWTSVFSADADNYSNEAVALAFGPDFIVAIGNESSAEQPPRFWVRKFAID